MVSLGASYTMGPNRRGFNIGFGEVDDFMVRGDTAGCFPSMESEGNAHLQQEFNEFLESQVYLQQGAAPPQHHHHHHHHPQIGTTTTTTITTAAAGGHVVHGGGGGGVGTPGEAVACLESSYGGLGGYASPMELAQSLLYDDDDDPISIHQADDDDHQKAMNFGGHGRTTTSPAAVSYGSGLAGGLGFGTVSPGSQMAAAAAAVGVNSSVPVRRQVPPRECWLEGNQQQQQQQLSSSSSRGGKRGDNGSLDPPSTLAPRRKIDKRAGQEAVAAAGRWPKRPTDQADHIMRERQRRDDMTSKFLVLESLLPGGAKRDRSTIVDDSIEYVKNLHHRIKVLQQRKLEMKQSATPALSPRTTQHIPTQRGRITAVAAAEAAAEAGAAAAAQKLSRRDEDCKTQIKVGATKEDLNEIHALLRSCLEKIDIHVDLPHQVLIELVCRPQRHFQSLIFQCLESLRLDVSQCSITKAAHRVVCVVSAQPREVTSPEAIQDIVDSLKQALGADQPLSSSGEEQRT